MDNRKQIRVLVTGGNGLLATELKKLNDQNVAFKFVPKNDLDITDNIALQSHIKLNIPDIVLHTAALTAPMKQHTISPEISIQTNIIATANLALTCIQYNIKLIYISTDYVYPGTKGPYKETDPLLPINDYAWSKLGGECSVRAVPKHLIIRSAHYPRPFRHDQAFFDFQKSSIYVDEAAPIIIQLIKNNEEGIINLGSSNYKTVYEFAKASKPNIKSVSRKTATEYIPCDIRMDLTKIKDLK